MSITLTLESFITGTKQSTLVEEDALDAFIATAAEAGNTFDSAASLADALVEGELITQWQANKLLQGKYRGFLLGRYRLKELLGKGEMSSVYLAEHIRMKRQCAIKVLPAHKVRETSYLGRFHREAEAVAQLDHPNIVRAYDVDVEEESGTEIHFLVMEYVIGRSVEKRVLEDGAMSVVEAAEVIRQASAGVAHAHAAGLVHRDIKPGNLLIDSEGVVKVLDLGLARFFKDQDRESLTIKHDEKVLGTADYLAPEQAVDSHAVDERADIYALGCTLFFALTGRPPFTEGTLVQRLLAHQTQAAPPISDFRDDCPAALVEILNKMMAKNADERYQTAAEVASQIAKFLVSDGNKAWAEEHVEVVASVRGVDRFLTDTPLPANRSADSLSSDQWETHSQRERHRTTSSRQRNRSASGVTKAPEPLALQPSRKSQQPAVTEPENDSSQSAVVTAGESVRSFWSQMDKQLVAIVALVLVAGVFAAAAFLPAQATDTPEADPQDTPTEQPESPTTLEPTVEGLSPILNEREGEDAVDFGLESSTGEPNTSTNPQPRADEGPSA